MHSSRMRTNHCSGKHYPPLRSVKSRFWVLKNGALKLYDTESHWQIQDWVGALGTCVPWSNFFYFDAFFGNNLAQ